VNLPRSVWGGSAPPSSFSSCHYRAGFSALIDWLNEGGYTVQFCSEVYQVDLNLKIITLDLEDFTAKKWPTLLIGLIHECGHILAWSENPKGLPGKRAGQRVFSARFQALISS
jgi:hypothetical protein